MALTLCVCGIAPRLELASRVIVVIHSREWKRASNTGHFAQLALANADIRIHGLPHQEVDTIGVDIGSPSTLVLYPGCGAKPLTRELIDSIPRPITLLVPDGNWTQARNMMRRVPMLSKSRAVELPGPTMADLARPRRNVFPDRMSTFEAIAQTLGLFEGEDVEMALLDFFRGAVDRMRYLRGKLPKDEIFGGLGPSD